MISTLFELNKHLSANRRERKVRLHRKCGMLFALGLMIVLVLAACGQAAPTQTPSPTGEAPSTAMEYFALGNELSKAGDYQKAADEYQKALNLEPENVDVLTNLGVAYYNLGQLDDAIEVYLNAIELAPNDGDIYSNLAAAYVQKYQSSGAEDQLYEALEQYKKAVELKPDLAQAHYGLGVVYALLGQNQDAIQAFEKFQELDTGSDPQATENAKQYLQQLRGE
jgi:tetratricopeptide (TPR) repeat protein